MDEKYLQEILAEYYGIENHSLEFLREGGTLTYIVRLKSSCTGLRRSVQVDG